MTDSNNSELPFEIPEKSIGHMSREYYYRRDVLGIKPTHYRLRNNRLRQTTPHGKIEAGLACAFSPGFCDALEDWSGGIPFSVLPEIVYSTQLRVSCFMARTNIALHKLLGREPRS